MAAGAAVLVILSTLRGSFAPVEAFGPPQWLSALYLGALGSALTFYLWAFALERTTPTRVAISVTVNPVAASLVGATLLGEPLRWNLVAGIVTVFIGIWIATTQSRAKTAAETDPALQELR
jgi:drug/metabolite transporter (DMT)-like permease